MPEHSCVSCLRAVWVGGIAGKIQPSKNKYVPHWFDSYLCDHFKGCISVFLVTAVKAKS